MFKLGSSEYYYFPITIEQTDEEGRYRKSTFDGKFKRFEQGELDAILERITAGELTDDDAAKAVLIGWRDVRDEHGNEFPYSDENRDHLLNVFPVRPSVVKAWFESLKVGKRKN